MDADDYKLEIERLEVTIADQAKKIDSLNAVIVPAESAINWPEIVRKLDEEVALLRRRLMR